MTTVTRPSTLHVSAAEGGGVDRYIRDIAANVPRRHFLWHVGSGIDVIEDVTEQRFMPLSPAIANGDAEIGMTQISEILPYAGAELVGPLPPEIQLITSFATAVGTNAKQPEPAMALIKFLTTPAAASVFRQRR